jgi:hypothetical protein
VSGSVEMPFIFSAKGGFSKKCQESDPYGAH